MEKEPTTKILEQEPREFSEREIQEICTAAFANKHDMTKKIFEFAFERMNKKTTEKELASEFLAMLEK